MDSLTLDYIREKIAESIKTKQLIYNDEVLLAKIMQVAERSVEAFKSGNKVILAGNGGSAADAQHIAAEFVSRFEFDRPGLPSISLTTDTSMLTAIGNDYGYEMLFSRQLEANAKAGDIFIGISTSGNSANILKAMNTAKEMELVSVGLGGASGKLQSVSDYCISVPSVSTPRIQESHILIGHIICGMVERAIFSGTHA